MKRIRRILASAIAIAVGLSSAYAVDATNTWWSVDFEGYTAEVKITDAAQPSESEGAWTSTGADASIVTAAAVGDNETLKGKINTEDGTLVWTPAQAGGPATLTKVLIDTEVYMVGSEDAPATSSGTVQTEVFLTNSIVGETTTSYLCAHVGDGGTGSKWVQLEGETITDNSWINLRIEIDYAASPPAVRFIVNSTVMTHGADAWFPVMYSETYQTTVTDVTFMGTGYFDNFIGKRVGPVPAGPTFEDGGDNTNSVAGTGSALSIDDSISGQVTATFATGTKYIQMTGPDGFVQTARVSDGVATFSTVDLPAGTYSITAYYGDAPTVIPANYVLAAEATDDYKAAEVVGGQIKLNVVPVSGLYYTLFAGETVAGATAAADSTLADPEDEDAGFLQLTMPVPENANEVKIIKIVASDDPYAAEDTIPTP